MANESFNSGLGPSICRLMFEPTIMSCEMGQSGSVQEKSSLCRIVRRPGLSSSGFRSISAEVRSLHIATVKTWLLRIIKKQVLFKAQCHGKETTEIRCAQVRMSDNLMLRQMSEQEA